MNDLLDLRPACKRPGNLLRRTDERHQVDHLRQPIDIDLDANHRIAEPKSYLDCIDSLVTHLKRFRCISSFLVECIRNELCYGSDGSWRTKLCAFKLTSLE